MTLVIDASVACKWFFEEDLSAEARALAASRASFIAPDMILVECANAAWRRVLSREIPRAHGEEFLETLPHWFESLVPADGLLETAFRMACTLSHPVYDCLYLALAERKETRLITADQPFVRRVAGSRWRNRVEGLHGD